MDIKRYTPKLTMAKKKLDKYGKMLQLAGQLEYLSMMTVGSHNWPKAEYDDARGRLALLKEKIQIELYYADQEFRDMTNGIAHAKKRLGMLRRKTSMKTISGKVKEIEVFGTV